jgi:DNA-binding Lrp family transcriptional regulator
MAMITSFVLINAQPNRTAALAEALADLDDVAEVVTKEIAALDGITRTQTLIAFRAYSRRDLEAMWAIGTEAD